MAVFNSIVPGLPWSQTFRFPAGAVGPAELMSASFRKNAASPPMFTVSEPAGIVRDGDDFNVQLTDVQTAMLEGLSQISFDLYATLAAAVRALQVRVHVQVRTGL